MFVVTRPRALEIGSRLAAAPDERLVKAPFQSARSPEIPGLPEDEAKTMMLFSAHWQFH